MVVKNWNSFQGNSSLLKNISQEKFRVLQSFLKTNKINQVLKIF